MLKLRRRARGHFMTLIEIRVHLIRVKPGHIWKYQVIFTIKVAFHVSHLSGLLILCVIFV